MQPKIFHADDQIVLVYEPQPGAVWVSVNRAPKHNALARPVLA